MAGIVHILFFITFTFTLTSGVFIAEFLKDGKFSKEEYLKYNTQLAQDLVNFTVCARVKVFFLRGDKNFFVSYANDVTDDAFRGSIEATLLENGTQIFQVLFCKYPFITNECINATLRHFNFNHWKHFCAVFTSVKRSSNDVGTSIQLYVDGSLANSVDLVIKNGSMYGNLGGGGMLVAAQEQDSIGGYFDETQSLSGSIAQLEIWNKSIDAMSIKKIANCSLETLDVPGKIVKWSNNSWGIFGKVAVVDVAINDICKPSPLQNMLIWPKKVSYNEFKTMCDVVNGKIPVISDNGASSAKLKSLARETFAQLSQLNEPPKNIESCMLGGNRTVFWLAPKKENGTWTNPYNSSTDFKNFDIIDSQEDCAYVFGDRIEPTACHNKFPCGVCEMEAGKLLKMKGLCKEVIGNVFDTDYYIHGTRNGLPHFRGVSVSHMFYDDISKHWILQSLKDPSNQLLSRATFPIGTAVWTIANQNGFCGQNANETRELTTSFCYLDMYTCNSGHCITLSKKCDTDIDCLDKSDEYNCNFLRFGSSYARELIPRDLTGKALEVYVNVSVLAFPSIDIVNLKFTADFYLNLRWYDMRVDFRDLNTVSSLNALSLEDSMAIWSPRLGFTNALGPFQTTVDALSAGVLIRESDPLAEDLSLSTEAMLFSGENNSIFLSREYYQDYGCNFDLRYYPFDTQICQMVFEVQGKTDNYVRLVKAGSGIEILSSKELVEYEIQLVDLSTTSNNNISRAMARVVFSRRMEFHVTNTFLQTFFLIWVGYLSLYFELDNFTDRIMVTLTTMLVVATVMSSISSSLPKTFYYKLIDWWLLFIMTLLVITMAFHTYVSALVAKAKKKPMSLMTENSVIFKKVKYSHSALVWDLPQPPYSKDLNVDAPNSSSGLYVPPGAAQIKAQNNGADAEPDLSFPENVNLGGKIIFVLLVLAFNGVFWYIAIREYMRPSAEYLNNN